MINIFENGGGDPVWLTSAVALLSTMVGGAVTYWTTHHFERNRDKQKNLSLAYSLIFTAHQMAEDIVKIRLHISESFSQAELQGIRGAPWTKLQDVIGYSEIEMKFSSDEMALIAQTHDQDTLMSLRELENSHRILLTRMRIISNLRNDLSKCAQIVNIQGSVAESQIDSTGNSARLIVNLDTISHNLLEDVNEMAENAVRTLEPLGKSLKNHYKFEHFIEVSFPEVENFTTTN